MTKQVRGRPPKPPKDRQAKVLQIGLTDNEWTKIEKASGDAKPVVWARDVLLRAAKRTKQ